MAETGVMIFHHKRYEQVGAATMQVPNECNDVKCPDHPAIDPGTSVITDHGSYAPFPSVMVISLLFLKSRRLYSSASCRVFCRDVEWEGNLCMTISFSNRVLP